MKPIRERTEKESNMKRELNEAEFEKLMTAAMEANGVGLPITFNVNPSKLTPEAREIFKKAMTDAEAHEAREAYEVEAEPYIIGKNFENVDDREPSEIFHEIATDAIARLDMLKNYFFMARQSKEIEAIYDGATYLEILTNGAAREISEKLKNFLVENGIHLQEAC